MLLPKRILLSTVFIFTGVVSAAAQDGEFFFSFSDGGATVGSPIGTFASGESGSAFVYYTGSSNIATGFNFELDLTSNGVIEFTGSEIFNPIAGSRVRRRWGGVSIPVISDDGQTIAAFAALNLNLTGGTGIENDNPELDPGYDAITDSFLLARVDFDVVGNAGQQTDLLSPLIQAVDFGNELDIQFDSRATIVVAAIPEPTSTGILAIGLLGVSSRRRLRLGRSSS